MNKLDIPTLDHAVLAALAGTVPSRDVQQCQVVMFNRPAMADLFYRKK